MQQNCGSIDRGNGFPGGDEFDTGDEFHTGFCLSTCESGFPAVAKAAIGDHRRGHADQDSNRNHAFD